MKKVYLDYAATTPVDPEVLKSMSPYFSVQFGNPSSIHSFGIQSRKATDQARKTIAQYLNAHADEIVFTSSATESNNLALQGVAMANRGKGNHIIISSIEHSSIEETVKALEQWGYEITRLPINKDGFVNPRDLEKSITDKTILVSIIFASNEIGVIQPIAEVGKICKKKNVYFHTDAVQAFGKLAIDVKKLNIDLLTASAHKIYGPKGAAILYVNKKVVLSPMMHGGGQEQRMRSSTVNVPLVVGFAKAVEIYVKRGDKENKKVKRLRSILLDEILKISGARLNGSKENRLSNNINVSFEGIDGEMMVAHLDLAGFACSTGAACAASNFEPSNTLLALGLNKAQAQGSLRITLGRFTSEEEVRDFTKILPKIVKKLQKRKS